MLLPDLMSDPIQSQLIVRTSLSNWEKDKINRSHGYTKPKTPAQILIVQNPSWRTTFIADRDDKRCSVCRFQFVVFFFRLNCNDFSPVDHTEKK